MTVRELTYENKKIQQEKDEIQAIRRSTKLHVQKQKETELLKKEESQPTDWNNIKMFST